MKILVIGSKGFIGSHCVQFFSMNHEVWECDIVTEYINENYFLIDSANANYNEVFKKNNYDVCINCSGAASVPDSIKNPQRDFMLNVTNVFKQLDAIRKHNSECKYINLSSAAVYGNPEYLPIDENHPLNPISPYGHNKKLAEDICEEFYDNFAIRTCSLRIFSAYGPGLRKQLFWDLYKKSQDGTLITLYGTGNESRDFIFIDDLVQAIDLVIQHSNFQKDIVNVANNKEIFIKDAVGLFYQFLQKDIQYSFGCLNRLGDPINWLADNSILSKMGYASSVSLQEGIKKYVNWLSSQ